MSEVIDKINAMIMAPSCCEELREAGRSYLTAVGTDREPAARSVLLAEIDEDVVTIDQLIEFIKSERGAAVFADNAHEMLERAESVKASGGKWCFCEACMNAVAVRELLQ